MVLKSKMLAELGVRPLVAHYIRWFVDPESRMIAARCHLQAASALVSLVPRKFFYASPKIRRPWECLKMLIAQLVRSVRHEASLATGHGGLIRSAGTMCSDLFVVTMETLRSVALSDHYNMLQQNKLFKPSGGRNGDASDGVLGWLMSQSVTRLAEQAKKSGSIQGEKMNPPRKKKSRISTDQPSASAPAPNLASSSASTRIPPIAKINDSRYIGGEKIPYAHTCKHT